MNGKESDLIRGLCEVPFRWFMRVALGFVLGLLLALASCGSRSSGFGPGFNASQPSEQEIERTAPSAPADRVATDSVLMPKAVEADALRLSLAPRVEGDRLFQALQNLQELQEERFTASQLATTRDFLTRSLLSLGWQVESHTFPTGTNLMATWPDGSSDARQGRAKKLLIGAHYDTVAGSPGADDNGTGVAALLEIAQLYGSTERAQELMLVFFDQEEQGLVGSLAFATPQRVAALRGAIILEMLGTTCDEPGCQQYPPGIEPQRLKDSSGQSLGGARGDRGDFIAVIGDTEHPKLLDAFAGSGEVQPWTEGAKGGSAEQTAPLPPLVTLPIPFKGILTPDVMRSDHAPFWLQGLGAVMVTDTANLRNPHYHRASDRLDTLNPDFFQGVVQQVVNAIAELTPLELPTEPPTEPPTESPTELPTESP